MVPARVPDPAVVLAGGFRVAVVEHRVERHLKCHINLARVPRTDADGGAQPSACAFTAHHDLVGTDAQRGGVFLQVQKRRIAIVHRRRIGRLQRQTVSRRKHDHAEALHQPNGTGHMHHFLHPDRISAAMQPQNAGGIVCRSAQREQQRRDTPVRRRDANRPDKNLTVRQH